MNIYETSKRSIGTNYLKILYTERKLAAGQKMHREKAAPKDALGQNWLQKTHWDKTVFLVGHGYNV